MERKKDGWLGNSDVQLWKHIDGSAISIKGTKCQFNNHYVVYVLMEKVKGDLELHIT